jgi:hypothetical protein
MCRSAKNKTGIKNAPAGFDRQTAQFSGNRVTTERRLTATLTTTPDDTRSAPSRNR